MNSDMLNQAPTQPDAQVKLPPMGEVLQIGLQGALQTALPKPYTPPNSAPKLTASASQSKNRLITDYLTLMQPVPAHATNGFDREKSD
jgi:hypothetical protein